MKRLYYLTKDIHVAELVSYRLHEEGISDWNFHVLGKDKAGLTKHHLHPTTPIQELDIIRSGERGVLMGLVVGVIVVSGLTLLSPIGAYMTVLMQLAGVALFSLFGAWVGGLVGVSSENYKIRRFHGDIDAGFFLLMVDVVGDQQHLLQQVVGEFSEIQYVGEDSTLVTPFDKPVMGH